MWNTVHALGGLLATEAVNSKGRDAAMRAADYLFRRMKEPSNALLPEPKTRTALLHALASLKRAGGLLDRPEYESLVEEWLDHRQSWAPTTAVEPTYLLAHQCAALIALGRHEMASHILDALQDRQMDDGAVLACSSQSSVCMASLAHLASCWYQVGNWQAAERALAWLEKQQLKTGAFPGRYGHESDAQAQVESLLAAKFYLDANRLRVISYMARITDMLPAEIDADDGRVQAVMELVRPGDRVLEVGCGKGRFLKRTHERHPDTECIGVDICPRLLEELPAGIRGVEGSLEAIPFPDNSFDLVFSVEAIEHSSNREAAVREMARVARSGGWVVIIDKQKSHWGRLACPVWESWPDSRGLMRLLRAECREVARKAVSYNHRSPDGLMIAWRGCKR